MRLFIQLIKELLLIFLYPFAHTIPLPNEKNPDNPKKIIVFVERWFNPNPFHKVWMHYLRKQGFATYIINFPIFSGTFEESAQKLSEYMEKQKFYHVVLVGISAGGITGILFLQHCNGWKYVDKFITLGTPFKGTPMAAFISFIRSGRELLPNSSTMKKLANEQIKNPEKITCISAKFDEMVPDTQSNLPNTKHIVLQSVGHNNFHLDTRKTYLEIMKIAEE